MKFEFCVDIKEQDEPSMRGQINVRVPEEQEDRYKLLNLKHKRRLSRLMREFAYKLMEEFETKAS